MAKFNPFEKGGPRKVKLAGAYNALKDDRRLIEECIDREINSPFMPQKSGVFLTEDCEDLPVFGPKGAVERVISRVQEGSKNQGGRIVFTKDNYGSRATGVGGQGGTMCEAIDIVAGALSCEPRIKTSSTETRANFISDGARIYLTERGDIQHYFALGDGSPATSITSNMKSGIGIKADHTLILGRERIRILAGFSKAEGVERLVNYNRNITPRIEIGQTGDDNAQPAVLGDNLVKYLRSMNEEIQTLRNRILDLEGKLIRYKTAMALHTHTGFGLGVVQTIPSAAAATQAAKSIPAFLETNVESIIDTYKQHMKDFKALGTENGVLLGSPSERLLSSTVYIGM